jgi:hypothetical protein
MKSKSEAADWVTANELYLALGGQVQGADGPIFARARAGLLAAIADKVIVHGEDVGPTVPVRLWPSGSTIIHNIDWERGDFHTDYRMDGEGTQYQAFGVRFDRADAVRMGADFSMKRKGVGGAPVQQDKWDLFYMAALQIAKEGRLNAAIFPQPKDLRDEILDVMQGQGHGKDTIDPKVKQIWQRFANAQ